MKTPLKGGETPWKDLDTVYRQHAQTVYKFLLSQCRDPQTAEELTQETFYQAVRSIDRFDGSCKVSVWLSPDRQAPVVSAFAEVPTGKRSFLRKQSLPLVPSAEEEAVSRSGQLDMLRRVHELPEPGREVVYLRAFRWTVTSWEIGDVLGKTETWARVTFYRGQGTIEARKAATMKNDLTCGVVRDLLPPMWRASPPGEQYSGGASSVRVSGMRPASDGAGRQRRSRRPQRTQKR
ncbi:MAG: RNA polymerase sigma factor [Dysosmobacter sp.]